MSLFTHLQNGDNSICLINSLWGLNVLAFPSSWGSACSSLSRYTLKYIILSE